MKDRVILLTATVLVVTVALFAWFTWARWGIVGIYPGLGGLVLGAAFFVLAIASRFLLSRRRAALARHQPSPAAPPTFQAASVQTRSEEREQAKVAAIEMK